MPLITIQKKREVEAITDFFSRFGVMLWTFLVFKFVEIIMRKKNPLKNSVFSIFHDNDELNLMKLMCNFPSNKLTMA